MESKKRCKLICVGTGKQRRQLTRMLVLFVLFILVFPSNAYAYLDMGTFAFALQLIVGALIGITVVSKNFWRKLKAFFVNLFIKRSTDQEQDE